MQRVKLTVEYDGTGYSGWQSQKNQTTVQDEIEKALLIIFKKDIRITAAGRTDAGVHARNQVVHFDIPGYDLNRLKQSLDGLSSKNIAIKNVHYCESDFHARFSAVARRYRYFIILAPCAISRDYVWNIRAPLNLTLLQQGADIVGQYSNFKSFCKTGSDVNHYQCQIYISRWLFLEKTLIYEIKANRFLHGMVRAIVGSLIGLGLGKITLNQLRDIIESEDQEKVSAKAPARGLILEEIYY